MKKSNILIKLVRLILFFSFIVILYSCGSSTRTIAVEDGWEMLGETRAGYIRETDVINVTSRNQFTALRFRVEGERLKISDLSIYFEGGDKLTPAITEEVPAGSESKEIQLAADGRTITKVELKYRTDGGFLSKKAKVYVFGKRYHTGY